MPRILPLKASENLHHLAMLFLVTSINLIIPTGGKAQLFEFCIIAYFFLKIVSGEVRAIANLANFACGCIIANPGIFSPVIPRPL